MPVMLSEAIALLNVQPGRAYVDATVGGGGHFSAIRDRLQGTGLLIGIDRDPLALQAAQRQPFDNTRLFQGNYADITDFAKAAGLHTIDGGIIADLGVSSMQLDQAERGFSFLRDGPLDMRMDPSQPIDAATILNTYSEHELADIIYRYGEERMSRKIAKAIVQARPITTTKELSDIVSRCIHTTHGDRSGRSRRKSAYRKPLDTSHPATRTFQAIRIAVNNELTSLEKFLHESLALMAPGARLVIISFHSLEDRLVKQIFRQYAQGCVCPPRQPVCTCNHKPQLLIITRKPVLASDEEVLANIRSRSAKLRAGEKITY
ncbi:MAG TPA: 16S rRNA (cytosine(1402)-N(4))-methyltransferase RsmH [Candidatus Obscuribacterales bacterium]